MKTTIVCVLGLVAAVCLAQAAPPTTAPATQTTTAPAADPAAVKILNLLEEAGTKYQTIQGNIEWTIENPVLGDKEVRLGWLAYQAESRENPVRIRLHFDTLALNDAPRTRNAEDYSFDGEWAIVAKERLRTMDKYQLAAPGERVPFLELGKSPLPPLPFGQKTEKVLKHFAASTRGLKTGEPAGTQFLRLDVRPEFRQDFNFLWVEIWMDPKLQLPIRIVGKEKNKNLQTVALSDIKTNVTLKNEVFDLPTAGYQVNIRRYNEQEQK